MNFELSLEHYMYMSRSGTGDAVVRVCVCVRT